jgi:transposase
LSTLLNDWGFSPQKPAKKAMEQNPTMVQKWLEEEYPEIETRAKKEKAEINWLDESGIQSTDNRRRSYAKKGKTPSVKISARRHRANFISTVNRLGTMRFMTYLGKMDSSKLIEFLRRLIRSSKKKIFVIVDNYSVHKSGKVRDWLEAHSERIEIFYLPTYSPELNPDEYLNRHLKSVIFKSERSDSRTSLRRQTEREFRKIQADKNF